MTNKEEFKKGNYGFLTLSDMVDRYYAHSFNNGRRYDKNMLIIAADAWKQLYWKTLRVTKNKRVKVDRTTMTVRIPHDCLKMVAVKVIDTCDHTHALTYDAYKSIKPIDTTHLMGCGCPECGCDSEACATMNGISYSTEDVDLGGVTYQKIIKTKLCPSGELLQEITEPFGLKAPGVFPFDIAAVDGHTMTGHVIEEFDTSLATSNSIYLYSNAFLSPRQVGINVLTPHMTITATGLDPGMHYNVFYRMRLSQSTSGPLLPSGSFMAGIRPDPAVGVVENISTTHIDFRVTAATPPGMIDGRLQLMRAALGYSDPSPIVVEHSLTNPVFIANGLMPGTRYLVVFIFGVGDGTFGTLGQNFAGVVTTSTDTVAGVMDTAEYPASIDDTIPEEINVVQMRTYQTLVASLDLKPCGCIKTTPENLKKCYDYGGCPVVCCSPRCDTTTITTRDNVRGNYKIDDGIIYLYDTWADYVEVSYVSNGEECAEEIVIPEYCNEAMYALMYQYSIRFRQSVSRQEKKEARTDASMERQELYEFLNPIVPHEFMELQFYFPKW